MRPTQREMMVLVAQAMQEYEEFYECLTKDLIFYQAFFLSLWSFFICCHKVREFLQTLISAWLKDSLKQSKLTRLDQLVLPQKIKAPILLLENPETLYPKSLHGHKHRCLFPPFTNTLVIEHILINCVWTHQ
jgi:hypothetical protein